MNIRVTTLGVALLTTYGDELLIVVIVLEDAKSPIARMGRTRTPLQLASAYGCAGNP